MYKIEGIPLPSKTKLENAHPGLKNSDLIPKVYEGGYKVWECSVDLVEYLKTISGLKPKNVLELGCGQGLPGIWALLNGANVVFTDYNKEVLEEVTMPCILHNISINGLDSQKDEILKRTKLIYGDWNEICSQFNNECDLILTSETIYNTNYYKSLHNIIQKSLSKDGIALIAAKRYYYGVGGGVDTFLDFVDENKIFQYEIVKNIDAGISNIRNIILMKFK